MRPQDLSARIARQYGFALKDPNPSIRFLALEGLEQLPETPEARWVSSVLNDTDKYAKWKAIQACGTIRILSSLKELNKLLVSTDLLTRIHAALSIAAMHTSDQLPVLLRAAATENAPKVRQTIIRALGGFSKAPPWDFLFKSAQDADVGVRLEIAKVLGMLTPQDPANRVKANVIYIFLKNQEAQKVQKDLETLLTSDRQFERASGAWLAGSFSLDWSAPLLVRLLSDEEGLVAERSAWALGKLRSLTTFPTLQQAYKHANQWALGHIVKAISNLAGEAEAVEIMKIMTRENNTLLRSQFLDILTDMNYPPALEWAQKYYRDNDHRLRLSSYRCIGRLGGPTQAETLFQGLLDANPRVKTLCAEMMLECGDFRALKVLADLLTEQEKLQHLQNGQLVLEQRLRPQAGRVK